MRLKSESWIVCYSEKKERRVLKYKWKGICERKGWNLKGESRMLYWDAEQGVRENEWKGFDARRRVVRFEGVRHQRKGGGKDGMEEKLCTRESKKMRVQ